MCVCYGKCCVWVRSWNCGCLVTWFCYQLIAKPGNKTASVPRLYPYSLQYTWQCCNQCLETLCQRNHRMITTSCPWCVSHNWEFCVKWFLSEKGTNSAPKTDRYELKNRKSFIFVFRLNLICLLAETFPNSSPITREVPLGYLPFMWNNSGCRPVCTKSPLMGDRYDGLLLFVHRISHETCTRLVALCFVVVRS